MKAEVKGLQQQRCRVKAPPDLRSAAWSLLGEDVTTEHTQARRGGERTKAVLDCYVVNEDCDLRANTLYPCSLLSARLGFSKASAFCDLNLGGESCAFGNCDSAEL